MARQTRRTKSSQSTDTAEVNSTEAPTEEITVTENTTEAEAPVESTEEAPIDLAPFQSVIELVVASRDEATGVLAEESLASVKTAYNDLDGVKAKNAGKKWAQEQMLTAVQALDGPLARAYSMVSESLVATSGSKSTSSAPVDPTTAFVQRVASLRLAQGIVEGNVPEKVSGEWSNQADSKVAELAEQVANYKTWLDAEVPDGETKPDAPEVSPIVRSAFKLATGKASGGGRQSGGSGPRGDIAKHIIEAFSAEESGKTLKVSEVANFKSSEYPTGNASQGAISARLFPSGGGTCTIEGVVPIEKGESGPRRVAKA